MTLSLDQYRRDLGEHRDQEIRLRAIADDRRTEIEAVEQQIADLRAEEEGLRVGLAQVEAAAAHEAKVVEALRDAIALLSERLPEPVGDHEVRGDHDVDLSKVGMRTRPTPGARNAATTRAPSNPVSTRAAELDLGAVTEQSRERAELIAQILREADEPLRQYQLAEEIAELLDCSRHSATAVVSRAMPILYREGRVRPVDPTDEITTAWRATPPEVASAGLGMDDQFAGKTTRWPRPEQLRPNERIEVETQPIEQGKRR